MNKRFISGLAALAVAFSGAGATGVSDILGYDTAINASAVSYIAYGTIGDISWLITSWGELVISPRYSGRNAEMPDFDSNNRAPWYGYLQEIKSVDIQKNVTKIGDYAFSALVNSTSVNIPNTVKKIGRDAFYCNFALTNVTIPDGVTEISEETFFLCRKLTSVTISDSVTSISNSAFDGCESLTSITIPDKVKSIGENAFFGCTNLTSITIPDGVTNISKGAFLECTSLKSVNIPDSVTTIGDRAFERCKSLTSITIPENVKSIGDKALGYDYDDKSQSNTKIAGFTIKGYKNTAAEKYANENQFVFISLGNASSIVASGTCGENLTWELDSEGTLTISGTGEMSYDEEAPWFDHEIDIKKVIIKSNVTNIRKGAFSNCTNLESVSIPDSVTDIGDHAFASCPALLNVTIPESVRNIGEYAFGYTYHFYVYLWEVTYPRTTPKISGYYKNENGITIKGYTNTAAEKYAKDNGFTFISLGTAAVTPGDLDGKNGVNVNDLVLMQKAVAGWKVDFDLSAADFNGNGKADVNDLVKLQKIVAGWKV